MSTTAAIKELGKSAVSPVVKQVAIYGLVAAASYFLIIKPIANSISNTFGSDQGSKEDFNAAVNSSTIKTNDGTSKATISDVEALSIADAQWKAMKDFGTDEDSLISTLQNLNGKDLQKVYTAFGLRAYYYGGALPGWTAALGLSDKLDLFNWYREEVDQTDSYFAQLQTIWKKAGMTL